MVTKRLMSIVIFLALVLFGLLALAWYDGGRKEMRMIEQQVDLPEAAR